MPKLTEIKSVGKANARKLARSGVHTTDALLKRAALRGGLQTLEKETGIERSLLEHWVKQAELFKVTGVGVEYAGLLGEAGVETLQKLARRNPDRLRKDLQKTNAARRLVQRLPGLERLLNWIKQAGKFPPLPLAPAAGLTSSAHINAPRPGNTTIHAPPPSKDKRKKKPSKR